MPASSASRENPTVSPASAAVVWVGSEPPVQSIDGTDDPTSVFLRGSRSAGEGLLMYCLRQSQLSIANGKPRGVYLVEAFAKFVSLFEQRQYRILQVASANATPEA